LIERSDGVDMAAGLEKSSVEASQNLWEFWEMNRYINMQHLEADRA